MSGADVCVAVVRIGHQALAQLAEKAAESAASFCSASSSSPNSRKPLQKSTPPFFGPADFDLLMSVPPPPLLAPGPSCSSRVQIEHQALALPKCRTQRGERAVDAALRFVAELDSQLLTRAVNIPLAMKAADFSQEPSCSASPPSPLLSAEEQPQLVLIPVTHAQAPESSRCGPQGLLEFCPFATVLHAAMNYDCSLVDAQSQDLLVRLGDWLSQGQCRSGPTFVHSLFLVPAAGNASRRILRQNSAMEQQMESNGNSSRQQQQQQQQEVRVAGGGGGNRYLPSLPSFDKENGTTQSSQQPSDPLRAELALASPPPPPPKHSCYTRFVVNPLFGTDFLPSRRRAMAPDYFVRGRPCRDFPNKRRRRSSGGGAGVQHQRSPTEFWEQQYPLHKHAFDGNAQKIRHLLSLGYDPNELDNDFWTPLHYCAFYNRLDACQALLLHPRTDVNVPNRTGASPLHFAALNGHVYVAELLLSHQLADINLRDSTGKTPLDLCAPVPKPDWQGVAFLLQQQNAAVLRPSKLEVQLLGGSVLQVEVDDPETATAGELREKVLRMEGLEPDALNTQIFAIWLVDSRLSLQLKAEQKVQVHLDKWAEHLEKFGGEAAENSGGAEDDGNGATVAEADRVRVVLKRDARALLADEQMLARKSPVAVSLLYGEAEAQFLRGMFPCHEKHFLPMAAIIGHRLYGAEWPRTVDAQFLGRILPRHLVPSATAEFRAFASLVSKLRQAHRQLLGLNLVQLQLRFLGLCWSLNVYGCTFFRAYMLMAKPLRGNLQVHVGLNDWGMSLLNVATQRQVAAIELDKLEAKFTPGSHFLEVQSRRRDFVATITTPQAQLINNLLKQIRLKVQSAKAGSGGGGGGK